MPSITTPEREIPPTTMADDPHAAYAQLLQSGVSAVTAKTIIDSVFGSGALGVGAAVENAATGLFADSAGTHLLTDTGVIDAQAANAPGMFSTYGVPAAGAVGMYDVIKNKRDGWRGVGQGAASGAAMGSYFGPPGTAIGAAAGAIYGGFGRRWFGGGYTKEEHNKHLDRLAGAGTLIPADIKADSNWDEYYQSGPKKGQKIYFDEAKGLINENPEIFERNYGNYDTFGNDWRGYTQDQRFGIIKKLNDENLYYSKKGDIGISDQERARAIRDEILGTTPGTATATTGTATNNNKASIGAKGVPVFPTGRRGGRRGGTTTPVATNPFVPRIEPYGPTQQPQPKDYIAAIVNSYRQNEGLEQYDPGTNPLYMEY